MSKLRLTVACGDYDIVKALKEGTVEAGGLELIFLTDMGPRERHWRLARKMEFNVCEENVGAYFMARDRGDPVTAIPVFLHRRFRHGFVFVNINAGIKSPKDLIGRQVGGTNFQPAGNIWMRGILEEHYGVPHREITWIVDRSEDVPFTPPPGLRIEMKTSSKSLSDMLADGDLPAMISPTIPRPFAMGDKRRARMSWGMALLSAILLGRRLRSTWAGQEMVGILLPPSVPGALVNFAAGERSSENPSAVIPSTDNDCGCRG